MFSVHVSNPLKGDNSKKQFVAIKAIPTALVNFLCTCAETPTSLGTKIGSICCVSMSEMFAATVHCV